jgi:hypothetical protein
VFKKLLYICLWLCVLSGTASTATPQDATLSLAAPAFETALIP